MSVRKTGDWAKARLLLRRGAVGLRGAVHGSVRQEGTLLRKEVVRGLEGQAPGGKALAPLSPLTLAARELAGLRGDKALVAGRELVRSITSIVRGDLVFVGVPKGARSKDGTSLAEIALAQELGAGPFVVPMTDAMRRFLFAMFARTGRAERSRGSGKGVVVIHIPPRPFLEPTAREHVRGSRKRVRRYLAEKTGLGGV